MDTSTKEEIWDGHLHLRRDEDATSSLEEIGVATSTLEEIGMTTPILEEMRLDTTIYIYIYT